MNVRDLARPEILALREYAAAGEPRDDVLLDNNESPWPAPDAPGLNRYPPQPPRELVRRMAAYYGVDASNVLPTRGADDAIDALMRAFCRPGQDRIVVTPPTFSMYSVFAAWNGVHPIEMPLGDDYEMPPALTRAALPGVKLVFLCSPNNPTGSVVPRATLEAACRIWSGQALIVVDEAYAEFMRAPSAVSLLGECDNLVVLRTLSKGLALAGARVGALLASPETVAIVRRVLPPYPLPLPSVRAAEAVLSDGALQIARERIRKLIDEREALRDALAHHPAVRRVNDSEANFLFVECTGAVAVRERLLNAGIRVRAFSEPRLANCLRVSVGAPAENRALLRALGIDHAA